MAMGRFSFIKQWKVVAHCCILLYGPRAVNDLYPHIIQPSSRCLKGVHSKIVLMPEKTIATINLVYQCYVHQFNSCLQSQQIYQI